MQYDIIVLSDNKTGGNAQAIALAKELGFKYHIVNISYNIFANLPNLLLSRKTFHITDSTVSNLSKLDTLTNPKLIISAGRRSATIALFLKKKYVDSKIIQIMSPNVSNAENFDLIILPQHDSANLQKAKIIRIIGALCKLNMPPNFAKFYNYYPKVDKFISILIGGDTKSNKLTKSDCQNFADLLESISFNMNLPLFVTFSRRTPELMKKILYKTLTKDNLFFDPKIEHSYDPYNEMVLEAKYIIVTADSISMCSEAALTGKPVYIYLFDSFKSKKHKFFIQQFLDLKVAKLLTKDTNYLENYYYKPLNEAKKIASIIRDEILIKP